MSKTSNVIISNTRALSVAVAAASLLAFSTFEVNAAEDGKAVYEQNCETCHGGGFKGFLAGAPKTGKDADWAELFTNGPDAAKKTVLAGNDDHTSMAKEKGLSAEQVSAAVDYVISQTPALTSKPK